MKTIYLVFSIVLLFNACTNSVDSNNDDNENNINNNFNTNVELKTISGTVPGTLIEAFCKDGSYYQTNSINDGTANHPFTLKIPKNLDCKLVMTTNENDVNISNRIVTPITLSKSTQSGTYFALNDDANIGYVPLKTSGVKGIQNLLEVSVGDDKLEIHSFSYDPLDIDNDGIPNVYEDDDNDGKYNKDDNDDDNDGIIDSKDEDHKYDIDADGIPNSQDIDDDGDGIDDKNDDDKDNDGIKDIEDDDDDNDGIKDNDDDDDNNDGIKDNYNNSSYSFNVDLPSTYVSNNGRLLGASCASCHGTNGNSVNSWDSIAGENDLLDEFYEDENRLMTSVSHGFTRDEVILIGNWLKNLPKNKNDDNEGDDDD